MADARRLDIKVAASLGAALPNVVVDCGTSITLSTESYELRNIRMRTKLRPPATSQVSYWCEDQLVMLSHLRLVKFVLLKRIDGKWVSTLVKYYNDYMLTLGQILDPQACL